MINVKKMVWWKVRNLVGIRWIYIIRGYYRYIVLVFNILFNVNIMYYINLF